ncbi:hypothetical protein RCL_jg23713.t1 [Rhizophagus clarus]|uniref:Uncharacterized protein n=1 Tax=Rhizophagus clarus TaxID=94130 RepID=A0A8H3LQB2_9GLOM|nr:hypothetical protein RCL_jg23713.t1 [Rhizophagus clarus]
MQDLDNRFKVSIPPKFERPRALLIYTLRRSIFSISLVASDTSFLYALLRKREKNIYNNDNIYKITQKKAYFCLD